MPSYFGAFSSISEFVTLELGVVDEAIEDEELIEEETELLPQETKKIVKKRPPKNLYLKFIIPPIYKIILNLNGLKSDV